MRIICFSGISATGEDYRSLVNLLSEQNATQFEQTVIILNHFLCGNESENLMEELLGTGGEANRYVSCCLLLNVICLQYSYHDQLLSFNLFLSIYHIITVLVLSVFNTDTL